MWVAAPVLTDGLFGVEPLAAACEASGSATTPIASSDAIRAIGRAILWLLMSESLPVLVCLASGSSALAYSRALVPLSSKPRWGRFDAVHHPRCSLILFRCRPPGA